MSGFSEPVTAADIEARPMPKCPTCGETMEDYGSTAGFICHGWKLLYRGDAWFDADGEHVEDRRLDNRTIKGVRHHSHQRRARSEDAA